MIKHIEGNAFIGDKAIATDDVLEMGDERSMDAVLPPKVSRKVQRECNEEKYKTLHLVADLFRKVKFFRRMATRNNKKIQTSAAFIIAAVHLATEPRGSRLRDVLAVRKSPVQAERSAKIAIYIPEGLVLAKREAQQFRRRACTFTRRWLPLICLLVVLIAAACAPPDGPDCDSLTQGSDPAIARVEGECVFLSHHADWLRIIGVAIENTEQGLLADDEGESHYHRTWYDRVILYGPGTAALANVTRDAVLNQRAVAGGHVPTQEEVSARLEEHWIRSETHHDFAILVKLAQDQDIAGFSKLAEETEHPDVRRMLEDMPPTVLMEALQEIDWVQFEQILEEGGAYAESFGQEHYWQEILPAKVRREMAISKLEEEVLEASADGPYAEVPRMAWLAYQEEAFEGVGIQLTRAAPTDVTAHGALSYLAEVLRDEQRELDEEYRRLLERRGMRD